MRYPRLSHILTIAVAMTTPARAGIIDTPLPQLNGQKAVHVFTVPGVTAVPTVGTVFMCASTEKTKDVTLGIEIFDFNGQQLNTVTTALIPVGNTLTLVTNNTGNAPDAFQPDVVIPLMQTANHGAARIVATSKNVVCTALLVGDGFPPVSMASLPVLAKTKQKGD